MYVEFSQLFIIGSIAFFAITQKIYWQVGLEREGVGLIVSHKLASVPEAT